MFFIAYTAKGQVHVHVCRMSEKCKPLVVQDKCNIEIFLSPDLCMISKKKPSHKKLQLNQKPIELLIMNFPIQIIV